MKDKLKKFLRAMSPLIAVQFLLLVINLLTGTHFMWSLIPIAAMAIPEFITFTHIVLSDDSSETASTFDNAEESQARDARRQAREAAREFRRQAKDTAREIRQGTWQGDLPTPSVAPVIPAPSIPTRTPIPACGPAPATTGISASP